MSFSEITIRTYNPPKKGRIQKGLVFRVEYKGTEPDTVFGDGSEWQTSGNLYNIFRCGNYLVAQDVFSQRLVFVAENRQDMVDILREMTKCTIITVT